jgi:hypothetical protein
MAGGFAIGLTSTSAVATALEGTGLRRIELGKTPGARGQRSTRRTKASTFSSTSDCSYLDDQCSDVGHKALLRYCFG